MSSKVSRSALRKRKKDAQEVKVALVGLDRITASLGLALRAYSDRPASNVVFTVLGRDNDNEAMKTAHRIGAVDNFNRSYSAVLGEADIIFVHVPMGDLEAAFVQIGNHAKSGAVIIDLSPIKQAGVQLAQRHFPKDTGGKSSLYLVGATLLISHDQLYNADRSVEAAQEFLFRNSEILIAAGASVPAEAVKVVTDIAAMLDMKPRFMDSAEHDGLASLSESIPLLMSAVLFQMVQQSPGKTDIMRATNDTFGSVVENLRYLAAEDVAVQMVHNRTAILTQLDQLTQAIETIKTYVSDPDPLVITAHMKQLLDEFTGWEIRRAQNRWDVPEKGLIDGALVGIPGVSQVLGRRVRRDED